MIVMIVYAVDKQNVSPCPMPARFATDIAYFMTPPDTDQQRLPAGEYRIRLSDAVQWRDSGVLTLVSPLDATHATEVELTEDQERFMHWLIEHDVEHVRLS